MVDIARMSTAYESNLGQPSYLLPPSVGGTKVLASKS